jgi:hypothetical protein
MVSLLAVSVVAFGQDPYDAPPQSSAPNPGWRQFSNPPSNYPPANYPPANAPSSQMAPSRLTLQAGTFMTVRVDQMLSSDKNQPGDAFSATLTRPLVAGGVVVAQRGQILGGRVAEAEKAGRVKGVSRLAVQLTDLTLVDGEQVPIETELTNLTGPTSKGRDAAAIVGSTALGAAVGGAADFGVGAAIGAGAGVIAGTVGVLLTRGHPTVIYPESILTFRLSEPVTISTDRAPQAFQYMSANQYSNGYNNGPGAQGPPPQSQSGWNCLGYGWPAPPYTTNPPPYAYYPYGYPYPHPYYWGPSIGLWFGRGFYGRGFYARGYGFRR